MEENCYTIRDLLKFIAEAGVSMDAKLKIAGGKNIRVLTLTYVPDDDALYFDPTLYYCINKRSDENAAKTRQ